MSRVHDIRVERDTCIGSADCVYVAPDVFSLDDERKAVVDTESAADTNDDVLWDAADSCPVLAILLYDEDGNEIFPQFPQF